MNKYLAMSDEELNAEYNAAVDRIEAAIELQEPADDRDVYTCEDIEAVWRLRGR